jgi:hypothetical protein
MISAKTEEDIGMFMSIKKSYNRKVIKGIDKCLKCVIMEK